MKPREKNFHKKSFSATNSIFGIFYQSLAQGRSAKIQDGAYQFPSIEILVTINSPLRIIYWRFLEQQKIALIKRLLSPPPLLQKGAGQLRIRVTS